MTISIQIQTHTGYASFTLVKPVLLVIFYMGEMSIASYFFTLPDAEAIYNGAWNLDALAWVILEYEPTFYVTKDNTEF